MTKGVKNMAGLDDDLGKQLSELRQHRDALLKVISILEREIGEVEYEIQEIESELTDEDAAHARVDMDAYLQAGNRSLFRSVL